MMHRTIAVAILAYSQVAAVNAQGGSKGRPPKYICPQDDGLQYMTPDPNIVTFQLRCGQGTTAKRIDNTPKDSQKECAIHCSEHPQCQSADYNWDTRNCARFSEYIPLLRLTVPLNQPGVNTWFPVEERKPQDPKPAPQPARTVSCPVISNPIVESTVHAGLYSTDIKCPEDDGKIFISAGGSYMQTRCKHEVHAPAQIAATPMSSLTECFNYCSDTPGCKSVSWEAGMSTWQCRLYAEGQESVVPCTVKAHGAAYVIDPPIIEAADDQTVLCSTECPYAHGQIWDSPSGERFRMSCCRRHGVQPFTKEHMPSLRACMAACGRVPACQSVDWQQATGMCYLGKHSGEATVSVLGWAAAHSMGCAGACRKEEAGCCGGGGGGGGSSAMGGAREEL